MILSSAWNVQMPKQQINVVFLDVIKKVCYLCCCDMGRHAQLNL